MLYVPRGIACTVESHKRRGGHTLYTYIYIYICDVCVCVCVCVCAVCDCAPPVYARARCKVHFLHTTMQHARGGFFPQRISHTLYVHTTRERNLSRVTGIRGDRSEARAHTRATRLTGRLRGLYYTLLPVYPLGRSESQSDTRVAAHAGGLFHSLNILSNASRERRKAQTNYHAQN